MTAIPGHTRPWRSTLAAAATYGLTAFAAGFACGVVRILWVAPALGEVAAALIELPFMLAASGLLVIWSINRFQVQPTIAARTAMGLGAFALLMLLEFLLARYGLGQAPRSYLNSLTTLAGRIGLGAQVVFAALPLLHLWGIDAQPPPPRRVGPAP